MLLRKTLYAFLTPPNIFFLLLLFACIFYYKRWAKKLILGITLVFALLSTPIVADRLHAFLDAYPTLNVADISRENAQAIVLLSAGSYGYNDEYNRTMPNWRSIVRALYAARLAKQTTLPILVSGGLGHEQQMSEAAILQNFLQLELHTSVRWIETQSATTLENALYSRALLNNYGITKIILVTERWHMRRAVMAFEHSGFKVLPAPTFSSKRQYSFNALDALVPSAYDFYRSQIAIHEIIGILWYKLEMLGS